MGGILGPGCRMSLLDIKGQERAITMIRKFIGGDAVNSSFLFFGSSGIGKHTAALNLAKALNCTGNGDDPCRSDDVCVSCKKIEKSIHPDVVELTIPVADDASQMETVVRTIEWLGLPLFEGRQKILIIDDASELNIHAQNALLKTLEEPPRWATIVLIASSYTRLLTTVQSRLIRVGFNRLSAEAVIQVLHSVTRLKDEEIESLGLISDGRIRYLSPDDLQEDVRRVIDLLADIKGPASIVRVAERFKAGPYRERFDRIIDITLSFLIDAILAKAGTGMLRNKGLSAPVQSFAGKFDRDALINAALMLEEARSAYELNVSPQMIMEHVLFELIHDEYADS